MRYVYFEGIFNGSEDIKKMLKRQYEEFTEFDRSFKDLMSIVNNDPKVILVLEMDELAKRLENWMKLLDSIKKDLNKYLEDQRVNFPRFYYVADDDLLEIIGNSKNIDAI
jgi:dynein heavy chain 1